MNMPKSRDIQAKIPSPKVILNAFWLVTVKGLNSYEKIQMPGTGNSAGDRKKNLVTGAVKPAAKI